MGVAHADVDWARGLVTANGVGIADRHAPNPAVARGTSRRSAEDAARADLAGQVAKLPVAAGGTVGDAAKDAAVKSRVDRAVANAIAIDADPQTDGAWKVTMAVPIEAVRLAISGGPAKPDDAPPIAILDGKPPAKALGAVPMLWVKTVPDYAKAAPHEPSAANPGTLYIVVQN
ncbi:MAG: hypothetical protein QM831_01130 [Kofleriaceae bacterium]